MAAGRGHVQLDSLPHHNGHSGQQHYARVHSFGPLHGSGEGA